jgi:AcrR family transcriptional regulator
VERETPRRGRPRSEEAHAAILDAAIALIREAGYDALTMEATAARAGAGKATLYRRWATKEALVAEAVERLVRAVPVPDTGTVEGDLRALLDDAGRLYRDPESAAVWAGLLAAMVRGGPVAAAVRGGLLAARRDALRAVLERGAARGEIRGDLDVAVDLLRGPLFFRAFLDGRPVDEAFVHGVVDIVLHGLHSPKDRKR